MIPDEEDIKRRVSAEQFRKHFRDQARIITSQEQEAEKILAPIKTRGIENNFLGEARELLERRRR